MTDNFLFIYLPFLAQSTAAERRAAAASRRPEADAAQAAVEAAKAGAADTRAQMDAVLAELNKNRDLMADANSVSISLCLLPMRRSAEVHAVPS